jgi:hypothetical protein
MELYNIGMPNQETIITKDTFIVDTIVPFIINHIKPNTYSIMFIATQSSTESSILLQTAVHTSDTSDETFLNNHELNMNNICMDVNRWKICMDTLNTHETKVYSCGFDMVEVIDKPYFSSLGAAPIDEKHNKLVDLLFTRDNFIKISVFFSRFIKHDYSADNVFFNYKFNHIKFSTINRIKLDGSATDINKPIVISHYTCGNGPETYKFNFISIKIPGRKLRAPMSPEVYDKFYMDDFLITDIIYEKTNDCVYVVYESRSDITNKYKETKVLKFYKEFYNRSNLMDIEKIYEEV